MALNMVGAGESGRRVLVGRFGAPHGVRGELRLQSYTQEPLAVASYGPLALPDGRMVTIATARLVKDNMLVVRIAGVADRNAAAALTNLELSLDRTALPEPEEDEFYVTDLIGLDAFDANDAKLGTIIDVPNYGGGDLVEVRPMRGGDTALFPFTREVVPHVDLAGRRVTIVPPPEVDGDAPPAST